MSSFTELLTDDELVELTEHPMDDKYDAKMDASRFALRFRIAKKLHNSFIMLDKNLTDKIKSRFSTFPRYGFYINSVTNMPTRVFGLTLHDSKWQCYTASCHPDFPNLQIAITPMSQIIRVTKDNWTNDQLAIILKNMAPGLFTDPCGFYLIMMQQANATKHQEQQKLKSTSTIIN